MINLHKLDIFTQVVQAGSFSRAAEGLLMSQSAVSQHMRDLEIALGTSLFTRGPRGVTLTPAGETLHGYVQQIFALLAEAENAVTDVKNLTGGRISIGATPGVSVHLFPEWMRTFRADYPHIVLSLFTGISSQILNDLRTGGLQIGIIEGELEGAQESWLGVQPLEEVEQLVVVGPRHPWWDWTEVPLEKLEGQGIIMRQPNSQTRIWLDNVFQQKGIRPKINGEFDNIESIKRAVTLGTCVSILPPYAVQQELERDQLRLLPITEKPLSRTLKLVWHRARPFSPIVLAFLQHLADAYLPLLQPFVQQQMQPKRVSPHKNTIDSR